MAKEISEHLRREGGVNPDFLEPRDVQQATRHNGFWAQARRDGNHSREHDPQKGQHRLATLGTRLVVGENMAPISGVPSLPNSTPKIPEDPNLSEANIFTSEHDAEHFDKRVTIVRTDGDSSPMAYASCETTPELEIVQLMQAIGFDSTPRTEEDVNYQPEPFPSVSEDDEDDLVNDPTFLLMAGIFQNEHPFTSEIVLQDDVVFLISKTGITYTDVPECHCTEISPGILCCLENVGEKNHDPDDLKGLLDIEPVSLDDGDGILVEGSPLALVADIFE